MGFLDASWRCFSNIPRSSAFQTNRPVNFEEVFSLRRAGFFQSERTVFKRSHPHPVSTQSAHLVVFPQSHFKHAFNCGTKDLTPIPGPVSGLRRFTTGTPLLRLKAVARPEIDNFWLQTRANGSFGAK